MHPGRTAELETSEERPPSARPPFAAVGGAAVERILWAGLAAVIVAVVAAGLWSLRPSAGSGKLPVLGTVPDFNLVERSGRPIARSELLGQPWIANFIFTSCAGVCPTLTASMARLHHELETAAPAVRTVSVSVDPYRDTPAVLSAYADRYHAAPDWLFLTGDRGAIHRLVSSGFRLSVAERSPEEAMGSTDLVTHSDRFALIDAEARIRGYYRGAEGELIPQILADVRRLAAEK